MVNHTNYIRIAILTKTWLIQYLSFVLMFFAVLTVLYCLSFTSISCFLLYFCFFSWCFCVLFFFILCLCCVFVDLLCINCLMCITCDVPYAITYMVFIRVFTRINFVVFVLLLIFVWLIENRNAKEIFFMIILLRLPLWFCSFSCVFCFLL